MALLFMDGFDAGDFAQKWNFVYTSIATPASSTGTRFGAGRSLSTPSSAGGGFSGIRKLITPSTTVYVGAAFMTNALSAGRSILILGSDLGVTSHLSLTYDGNTGALKLYRGDLTTLIATSAGGLVSANTWMYLEISATVADAGGSCEVRFNGVTAISFSGDTRNAGTSANIDAVTLQTAVQGATGFNCYWDDVYVCDGTGSAPHNTFLGDVRITSLVPNAAGANTGFAPSTGANYTTVDELPYSATDYVSASVSGTRDTYAMTDISAGYTVLGLQNNIIAKKTDAGGTAVKPAVVSGGTVYYGASKVLGPTDTTISDIRATDPATSVAWTVSGINALEAGMEIA